MSRIDQALKRATRDLSADARVDPRALDEYPTEEPERAGFETHAPRERTERPTAAPDLPAPPPPPRVAERPVISIEATERTSAVDLPPGVPGGGQYRRLAEALQAHRRGRVLKTVAVTCAEETPEKTGAALGLAAALTRVFAHRVLVIDADAQPPFAHEILGGDNDVGVSDVLRDKRREIRVTRVSPLLHLLAAGSQPAGAGAAMVSAPMRTLVAECAAHYDWVLVNAPAVSLLPDAHALALQVDIVVFVVGRRTRFPLVERAIAAIGREHVAGTLLLGLDDAGERPDA